MENDSKSERAPRRRVDAAAKAHVLSGLREGLALAEAARQAGFSTRAFDYARKRDPVFALAWAWALELSAADGRAARGPRGHGDPGDIVIAPAKNRLLQKRHVRRRRFDDRRKQVFLDHFAVDADAHAACAAAGVAYSTYTQHRRKDPEFGAGCEAAIVVAYAGLEAEVLRERLEALRNLRDGICPAGDVSKEFDRNMRLLARLERRGGGIGTRFVLHGAQQRWDFMDAIAEADRRLRALGARHGIHAEPVQLPKSGGTASGE